MANKPRIPCAETGKMFTQNRADKRFASTSARQAYYRRLQLRGEEIITDLLSGVSLTKLKEKTAAWNREDKQAGRASMVEMMPNRRD